MAELCQHRTAVTRLEVSESDRELLEETISEWKRGCQIATDMAWDSCDEKRGVQSLAYDDVRAKTNLGSQHAILATHQAAQAISTCLEQRSQGRQTSKPQFTAPTIKYDSRTMTLFDDDSVSLTTVESRVRCDLALPSKSDGYQYQFLDSDEWEATESTLTVRNGKFCLHLTFRRYGTNDDSTAENGTVLGVDLGVENLAVTSTAKFFSGGELNHERREFEKRRGRLQQVGTQSAQRTLRSVIDTEGRYVTNRLHCISKQLMAEAREHDCDAIAFEELSGIRESIPKANWFHLWAFRRLVEYTEYKAEECGIEIFQVKPAYTSLRCSECGDTSKSNRRSRGHFECGSCGMEANADYNAAKNIGLRCVRGGQQSSLRTGISRCALKSGTVTQSGGFEPYN